MVGDCYASLGKFSEALPWFERAATAVDKTDVWASSAATSSTPRCAPVVEASAAATSDRMPRSRTRCALWAVSLVPGRRGQHTAAAVQNRFARLLHDLQHIEHTWWHANKVIINLNIL
jgi:hypothetical protein